MNLSSNLFPLLSSLLLAWLAFITATLLMWRRSKTFGAPYVALLGVFLCASYLAVALSSQTMFWGMTGDESFIASMFEHQAWGRLGADLTSYSLPLFYPPLYFIAGGIVGKIFHLSGIGIAKTMAAAVLLCAPLLFYGLLRFWHKKTIKRDYAVLAAVLLMTALPFDAIILKPYEMISGIALAITAWGISAAVGEQGSLTSRQWIVAILSLAILFCTFYFWFLLLALAVAMLVLMGPRRKELARTWGILGIVTAALSSWYWLPNVLSFIRLGYENWQPLFFVRDDLQVFSPFSSVLSLLGAAVFAAAIGSLIVMRKSASIKILGTVILSAYLYHFYNDILFFIHQRPMQGSKGYLFFAMPSLILIAAMGIQKWAGERYRLAIPAIILVASVFTLPAAAVANPALRAQLMRNETYRFSRTQELNGLFAVPDLKSKTLLTSGIPELEARAPYQEYLTHNINLAHPALGFSQRHDFVAMLAKSKNPQEFAVLYMLAPRQTIDGMLLYHDGASYHLYYWLDNFPNGGREEVISFPRSLVSQDYFQIINLSSEFDLITKK